MKVDFDDNGDPRYNGRASMSVDLGFVAAEAKRRGVPFMRYLRSVMRHEICHLEQGRVNEGNMAATLIGHKAKEAQAKEFTLNNGPRPTEENTHETSGRERLINSLAPWKP